MKKYITVIIVALLCSVAFAAVQLTITVPDKYTVQVLDAMNTLTGKNIMFEARSQTFDGNNEFVGSDNFIVQPKDPNETNKDFAERFTRELLRASVRVVKSQEETERYRNEVEAIEQPDIYVPDEVVE